MKPLCIMGIVVMSAIKIRSSVTGTIVKHVKITTYVQNATKIIRMIMNLWYSSKQKELSRPALILITIIYSKVSEDRIKKLIDRVCFYNLPINF